MTINPAVLDQAIGLLDLIALVRDPGASKAVLGEFVAQREAAEKAQQNAIKIQVATQKQIDELQAFQQKRIEDEARINAAREACAEEQKKLSDARDDVERGREEIKQHQVSVELARLAMASEREAIAKQRLNLSIEAAAHRDQLRAEQAELDVRAVEVEAANEALNAKLLKFRALAGE